MKKIILIGLLIGIVLVSGCIDGAFSAVKSKVTDVKQEISVSSECKELANSLIPETIMMSERTGGLGSDYVVPCSLAECVPHWNDGTEMDWMVQFGFGSAEGQNINYNYGGLNYNKQIVGEEGTIYGNTEFVVDAIMRNTGNCQSYRGWTTYCEYEFVETTISSCHWITDSGEIIT